MQYPIEYLSNEAQSLLTRLSQVKPFSMTMPMVKGASVSHKAFNEIMELLEAGKDELKHKVIRFIDILKNAQASRGRENDFQSSFILLKLRFNNILDQLDIFADVLSQRSEHDVGVWLAGLDVLAEDGLSVVKKITDTPSLVVYLDRGHGAAIRRARTRLPGGDENPVAVIQIPRERMVGSGIASSLVHEVGHQAAAILDLVATLKSVLVRKGNESRGTVAWKYFERWISEIVCDVWAAGHLGIAATMGLMGVVTLPRYFQFRLDLNDPHPAPYVRVFLSYAVGKKLFPHAQWDVLWNMWKVFYPKQGLNKETLKVLEDIENHTDDFVDVVLNHSTKEMKGRRFYELFPLDRTPSNLKQRYSEWKIKKTSLSRMPPTLVFAVLGQAKFDLAIDAAEECRVLTDQLKAWAYARN